MSDVMVNIEKVNVHFRKPLKRVDSLKEYVLNNLKGQIRYEDFSALIDINLSIHKREVMGFIGLNGAGKSTLMKLIARVQKPTSGEVTVNGKVSPLLELGAGFDGNLSGRENIRLNSLLLGYGKDFAKEKTDEIVDFAELHEFIDTPVKNYSSGMKARLAFSIAISKTPEILIVDEILSVGDGKFRKKSENKMLEIIDSDATVLFVSHNITQIRKLCSGVVWLDKGRIRMSGDTDRVCDEYEEFLQS